MFFQLTQRCGVLVLINYSKLRFLACLAFAFLLRFLLLFAVVPLELLLITYLFAKVVVLTFQLLNPLISYFNELKYVFPTQLLYYDIKQYFEFKIR